MKILINAMSLTSRGTYSLLVDFLEQMRLNEDYLASKGIFLHFLVAVKELERYSSETIKIQYEFFSKKGLLNRFYYEKAVLPRFMKENETDAYLCLQNTSLYAGEIPQFVLIQQSLHFSGFKLSELSVGLYIKYCVLMNVITRLTIKNYTGIIVQTNWVKNAIISKYGYGGEIRVILPELKSITGCNAELPETVRECFNVGGKKFIYVTSEDNYKNNDRLVEAVKKYNVGVRADSRITLFLTIDGASDEDVKYIGKVPYEAIYTMYKRVDVLIFPSLCETLGLPLQEAMSTGLAVLASDLPYAREVCGDYARYFDPRDVDSIEKAIGEYFGGNNVVNVVNLADLNRGGVRDGASYKDYIDFVYDMTCGRK